MSKNSGDKRVVTTDALETLGTIHKKVEKRDAIHLAVEPVEAGEDLEPGSHINVDGGVAFFAEPGDGLGIVDPFLTDVVRKGQRFWFVMYPGKVHSLRHVWTHPAFPDAPELAEVTDEEVPQETKKVAKKALNRAKEYITNHASALNLTYEELMERADDWVKYGNYHIGGAEAEGYVMPKEFWAHWEVVTGREVPDEKRHNFISCSC